MGTGCSPESVWKRKTGPGRSSTKEVAAKTLDFLYLTSLVAVTLSHIYVICHIFILYHTLQSLIKRGILQEHSGLSVDKELFSSFCKLHMFSFIPKQP